MDISGDEIHEYDVIGALTPVRHDQLFLAKAMMHDDYWVEIYCDVAIKIQEAIDTYLGTTEE